MRTLTARVVGVVVVAQRLRIVLVFLAIELLQEMKLKSASKSEMKCGARAHAPPVYSCVWCRSVDVAMPRSHILDAVKVVTAKCARVPAIVRVFAHTSNKQHDVDDDDDDGGVVVVMMAACRWMCKTVCVCVQCVCRSVAHSELANTNTAPADLRAIQ